MQGRGLTTLPDVEVLSPLVTRILGQNPGPRTLQGTNTYLVGRHPHVVLIDTGVPDKKNYIDLLSNTLQSNNLTIKAIIITHWHHDHLGGCSAVLKLLQELRQPDEDKLQSGTCIPVYKYPHQMDSKFVGPEEELLSVSDNQVLQVYDDVTLRVLHTPGHTEDSISLHLLEENSLFCGDTILGGSSTEFSNYTTYISSLYKLRELGPERLYTGHGVVEGRGVIDQYIAHRQSRERQVLDALRTFKREPVDVEKLTEKVYENDNLQDSSLILSAQKIVGTVLEKLAVDGTAKAAEDGLWVAT